MMKPQKNNAKHFARSERATARNAAALFLSLLMCFSFTATTFAAAEVGEYIIDTFWYILRDTLGSELGSFMTSAVMDLVDTTVGAYEGIQKANEEFQIKSLEFAQLDEPIQYFVSAGGLNYGWKVNEDIVMNAEEQKMAEYMVSYLNTNCNQINLFEMANDTVGMTTAQLYEQSKKYAFKAWQAYYADYLASFSDFDFSSASDFAEAASLPTYDFDFVGPVQGLTIPTKTGYASLSKNGYCFSPPSAHCSPKGFTKTFVESHGYTGMFSAYNGEYYGVCNDNNAVYSYSAFQYVLYNGNIYYYRNSSCSETGSYSTFSIPNFYTLSGDHSYDGRMNLFYSSDGTCLASVAKESDIPSFYVGYGYSEKYTGESYPGEKYSDLYNDITIDDFTAVIGGGETEIPLSDSEQAVSNALAVGLINDDSLLTIDENGSITAADGISIEKLNEIVEMLKSGSLEFEDIQSYLQTISQLVANGNLTAQQQKAILDNVGTYVGTMSDDISKINANIASIAAALELDKTNNLDFDIPSTPIIDKFPFSIPFDFYNILTLLIETPKEPIFYIRINTDMNVGGLNQSIDETITLDLTQFKYNGYDIIRIITNSTSILLFSMCLISGTKKLIWK